MAISGLDQRTTAKVILISVVAAVGGFLFGFDAHIQRADLVGTKQNFFLDRLVVFSVDRDF